MSASNVESEWNFRIVEKRLVTIKKINTVACKIAVLDVLTNLMFTVDVTEAIEIKNLAQDTQYLFTLNIYTSKNLENVEKDFLSFFEAVDIDQEIEDFIKAFRFYPTKIRFDLVEVEDT